MGGVVGNASEKIFECRQIQTGLQLTHAVVVEILHALVAELAVHRRLGDPRIAQPALLHGLVVLRTCRCGWDRIHPPVELGQPLFDVGLRLDQEPAQVHVHRVDRLCQTSVVRNQHNQREENNGNRYRRGQRQQRRNEEDELQRREEQDEPRGYLRFRKRPAETVPSSWHFRHDGRNRFFLP